MFNHCHSHYILFVSPSNCFSSLNFLFYFYSNFILILWVSSDMIIFVMIFRDLHLVRFILFFILVLIPLIYFLGSGSYPYQWNHDVMNIFGFLFIFIFSLARISHFFLLLLFLPITAMIILFQLVDSRSNFHLFLHLILIVWSWLQW